MYAVERDIASNKKRENGMAALDKKNVSMNDVARAAGVSLKTVSRAINEPESVRPATRQKIEEAMAQLGFRSNFAARSLKLGRYGCIGVVLFHLSGGSMDMLDGIATAAADRGFALTLIKKKKDEKMTLFEASQRMSRLPVDGMIFNLGQMVDDFAEYRSPKDLKTVIITPMEHATCSTVSDDQEGSARMACDYLLDKGHKTVYFISGKDESLSSVCRMRGWKSALEARGITPPEPLRGDWEADSGYAAGEKLAQMPECTAVLAANDCMANGAMVALHDAGLSVPDDVSVIGFDDELYKTVPNSILTSVKFGHEELGVRALNEVVSGLDSPESKSRILVSGRLIERASVRDLTL